MKRHNPTASNVSSHLREGEQQQGSSVGGIDRSDSWPDEQEIDQPKALGSHQSANRRSARQNEDGGRVESDDVDTVHLLGNLDGE